MKKISLTPLLFLTTTVIATAAAPTEPINAGAYNFTDTSARISFKDMSMDETGFRIEHVQAGNTVLVTHTPDDTNTTGYEYVNLTGLTPQTLYTIDIIAFNADGNSMPLRKSFRTLETPNTPTAPTTAGATDVPGSTTSKRISFLDTADNEDGFKIYNDGVLLDTIPANTLPNEFAYSTLTGLSTCTLYNIDIVAYNADGESDKLAKSFMTPGCMTDADIPLAPSSVGVYNITNDSARVSFMDNANNEAVTNGFIIYNNDDNTILATLPRNRYLNEYQYANLTNLLPNTPYTIRVVAANAAGEGAADLKSFRTLP